MTNELVQTEKNYIRSNEFKKKKKITLSQHKNVFTKRN